MTAVAPPEPASPEPSAAPPAGAPGTYVDRNTVDESSRVALGRSIAAKIDGVVAFDDATRAVYATDSSNYRQIPLGVVFPRSARDVQTVVTECAAVGAAVLGRGAGTGLAGQTVNVGVVLDFSRFMNAILDIDPARRVARVQPGLVLDDLRAAAEEFGLTFGPDPATHAWCTLGGMIGNNSCGTHALYAGKTVDNVRRLRIVTASGADFWVGRYDDAGYAEVIAEAGSESDSSGGELARLLGGARELGRRYAELVTERFPDIPRRVSGYNLDQVLPGRPADLARLLVGSESTLALVVEAELDLAPSPAQRHLVVLGYDDIFLAADAVPSLVAFGLLGLEGMDQTLIDQSAAIGLNTEGIALLPPGHGWLLAEIGDDDPDVAERRVTEFIAGLPAGVAAKRISDPVEVKQIWSVRESGLAATARPPGRPPNHEGWEDAAVPPDRLGEYLRRITALWAEYGYSGAWYGHFGQGCVHTRNPFDFHSAEGLRAYRSFIERAADVVAELGGSVSGEHGDGQARGELLGRMFGPEIIEAFRSLKSLFDPAGMLNPGKLVDPFPLDTNLKHGPTHHVSALGKLTIHALPRDNGSIVEAAERCVGVGRCRRDDLGVMCPSYRATRDERHSTRGRAKALQEMFAGEISAESWRNDDVHDALSLCLACKGCAVDCPTGVDMATYKSEFNAHYYSGRLRPRHMFALGLLPWASRLAAKIPAVANRVLAMPALSSLVRRTAGVTTSRPAPRFAGKSFRATVRRDVRRGKTDGAPPTTTGRPSVVLWPDTFTDVFDPQLGSDTLAALQLAGESVHVPTEWACCGRTLYDPGMLSLARTSLRKVLDIVDPFTSQGIPVVVPEPSCLAAFRDELPQLLPDDPRAARLAGLARSLAEHLVVTGVLDPRSPDQPDGAAPEPVLVHPHCHGRATVGIGFDRDALTALGYPAAVADAGCCGLAGSFGFAAETSALGRQIGEQQWLPKLRAQAQTAGAGRIAMDGFSCLTQYTQLSEATESDPVTVAALIRAGLQRRGSIQ
ncbi:FAD-binding and (Fe-S)-binding domain-containing protein [Nakamurella aerolata]|uniref:FAD-binding oxidoreductase n=1 Tax=Nakamurella aerolata TaxID=1656892 RepID=A0A849A5Q5_9ACTN|nr:FAD-binding and (Fe-S)-binding domain-containing protein [Nakamurella aerolata]NNG34713.1 FAD-binding oxidoreductase [Nakamurella aerolata]